MRILMRHALALFVSFAVTSGGVAHATSCGCHPRRYGLDEGAFQDVLARLKAEPFAEEQLAIVRELGDNDWLTCEQIVRILPLFQWKADRVRAVEVVIPAIWDRANVQTIANAFDGLDRRHVRVLLGLNTQ